MKYAKEKRLRKTDDAFGFRHCLIPTDLLLQQSSSLLLRMNEWNSKWMNRENKFIYMRRLLKLSGGVFKYSKPFY